MPIRIYWTKVAQDDLRSIKQHIAVDAPATAIAYIRKLRSSVNRLKTCPILVKLYLSWGGKRSEKFYRAITGLFIASKNTESISCQYSTAQDF